MIIYYYFDILNFDDYMPIIGYFCQNPQKLVS